MADILPFLKSLLALPGLSAYENPAAEAIIEKWTPLADEINLSRIGSVQALKAGDLPLGDEKSRRPSVMIATHMDAIGMMVTQIKGEFMHITMIGGVDQRVLPGTPIVVHATGGKTPQELPGVVVMPPARALPASIGDNPVPMNELLVDVGLLPRQVAARVRVGDLVSYATAPTDLSGEVISGHSLDNRASVAALTVALEDLQTKSHAWDVWAVATAQEEETYGGAFTSAFGLRPDLVIAVDVTFATGPGANDWQTHSLGKGVALGWGPNVHPFLYKKFEELARRLEIPYEISVIPRMSGTDGYAAQITAEGLPTMIVSIPLRYMHTPVEMVAVKDIVRAGRLLAEFIAALTPDFMDTITWDD